MLRSVRRFRPQFGNSLDSLKLFGRLVQLGLVALAVIGCSSSTTNTTVEGEVVNGPLVGAEVTVYTPARTPLGSGITDGAAGYVLNVPANPPYRIETQGGELDGTPYEGRLKAWCETPNTCPVTPYTTVLLALMDTAGFNAGDARAHLSGVLGFDDDPFLTGSVDPASFRVEDAQAAINGGLGLNAWVDSMVAWVLDNSQPVPAGVPTTGSSYLVSPSAGTGGSITPDMPQSIASGSTTSFTVTPDAGYDIDTVSGCGGTLSGNTFTTDVIAASCVVSARFSPLGLSYTITPEAGAGGSINPSAPQLLESGETTSFTITPDDGYVVSSISGCSGSLDGNTFTTDPAGGDCTLSASFVLSGPATYEVTATAGTGGSIDPGLQLVAASATASFTLTPDTGYSIGTVDSACGGTLSGDTFTTDPVTAACTVSASFSLNSYTVTPNAGSGGSISPSSPLSVNHGDTASFIITADAGYGVGSVSGCDGSLSGDTYTTGVITAPCTVNADFTLTSVPQNLAVTLGEGLTELSWEGVAIATDYCVYVSQSSDVNPDTAASYDTGLSSCTGNNTTSATVTGLINGTRYYFVVTARTAGLQSGPSNRVTAVPQKLRALNDTGIDWCADGTTNNLGCPVGSHPGQDGDLGRDRTVSHAAKVGGGEAGFDFTRICNSGQAEGEGTCPVNMNSSDIGNGPDEWACTRDNVTGLMWEVKAESGTRSYQYTYHWYDPNPANAGGTGSDEAGSQGGNNCNAGPSLCFTNRYIFDVNAAGLCGHTDWRMPSVAELSGLVHNGRLGANLPAIDVYYFPNTRNTRYWASSSYAEAPGLGWFVDFGLVDVGAIRKDAENGVRLVRSVD
ncbi:InlB B-repeat-containing protein [Thioalkalivibrio sulfidiphilus]|uniref:InlB B-repeat-containing protein n=1 Tax=Thioalkalivibrio sulfidiphilus TaxID=1033854 RepID=UPI003BAFE2BE